MRTLAIINQKGGVGKTTTTANLAHALALMGKKVTAIDLDPQGHLSATFGFYGEQESGMDEVFFDRRSLADLVQEVRSGFYLVPAGPQLREVELRLDENDPQNYRLREAVTEQFGDQDFVLLDCPPATGFLVMNALTAADETIVPVAGDYLGLRGLGHLMRTLEKTEKNLQRRLDQWIVVTRFHARRRLAKEVLAKLMEYFQGKVLATPIRETTALAESPSFGMTIFEYAGKSHGASDYHSLALDYLNGRTM